MKQVGFKLKSLQSVLNITVFLLKQFTPLRRFAALTNKDKLLLPEPQIAHFPSNENWVPADRLSLCLNIYSVLH